eukprot:10320677-Ditylum_brightwellii.AAC.1
MEVTAGWDHCWKEKVEKDWDRRCHNSKGAVRNSEDGFLSAQTPKVQTKLRNSIDKLKAVTLANPTTLADTALQIDKDIYKEEVREYVRERKALERVTKQAYALVWGQ